LSNDVWVNALKHTGKVAILATEEEEEVRILTDHEDAKYCVVVSGRGGGGEGASGAQVFLAASGACMLNRQRAPPPSPRARTRVPVASLPLAESRGHQPGCLALPA